MAAAIHHLALRMTVGSILSSIILSISTINVCSGNVCRTQGCIEVGKRLKDMMDPSIKPCDNFYKYACGQFIKNTVLEKSEMVVNQVTKVMKKVENDLIKVLNKSIVEKDTVSTKRAKTLFKSCTNMAEINKAGVKAMVDVTKALGGWPVITPDWKDETFNVFETIYKIKEKGLQADGLIKFSVEPDDKNTKVRIIHFDSLGLWNKREILTLNRLKYPNNVHVVYALNISSLMGAKDRDKAKKELVEAYKFLITLAEKTLSTEDRRNGTLIYNKRTIKSLASTYPNIPWLQFANKFLHPHHKITENEEVVVRDIGYFQYLNSKLNTFTKEEKRSLANVILWRGFEPFLAYLSDDVLDIRLKYNKILSGVESYPTREIVCTKILTEDSTLTLAVGALYVREFYNNNITNNVTKMVTELQNQFQTSINSANWIDQATKQAATTKLAMMKKIIGYPEELLNNTILNEEFYGIHFRENKFLENMFNLTIGKWDDEVQLLRKPVILEGWEIFGEAAKVDGYYLVGANTLFLTAAVLQGPMFSSEYPAFANYGGIGFLIGHEITHGFDDEGRYYNGTGDLVDWWQPSSVQNFQTKEKCFVSQYSLNDTASNQTLDGELTLSENIADNGGVKQSYNAFVRLYSKAPDVKIPDFESFTKEKMFWLSTAAAFCEKARPEYISVKIGSDEHTIAEHRVNIMLQNMPQFGVDWSCAPNSPMTPSTRCALW